MTTAGPATTDAPGGTGAGRGEMAGMIASHSVVVCCGSGGAGKTTVAAALGVAGAAAGRRVCVVTIDPARRLADALGLESLGNLPERIEGPWPGELSAVMLDAKGTFDELVERYAGSAEQALRIKGNSLYRNLTSALSGTQEYMAMEKLYELHTGGQFDLVVVDTPPTRNALDFLDAPKRLYRFLENRVFRLLLMPTRAYMKAMTVATQVLLRTISKVAGAEIVEDAVAFFQAFEGMEQGFRERARRVEALLADAGTAFVLVAAPREDSVSEARFFAERLATSSVPISALVVNRMFPDFSRRPQPGEGSRASASRGSRASASRGSRPSAGGDVPPTAYGELVRNLEEFAAVALLEATYVADLEDATAASAVVLVPLLDEDVHDLDGLDIVARHLTGAPVLFRGGSDPPGQ